MGNSFSSIRDTTAHIYAAELVWYSRWRGNSPKALISGDTFPDFGSLRFAWRDLERDVRAFVAELGPEGINRRVAYTLLSGQATSSIFWHLVQHVVNHGSYHRGQVTTLLRQIGVAPPKGTDLVPFYREREAEAAKGQTA